MTLQEAIDISHDIREYFPHVCPNIVPTSKCYRDGSVVYILGVYQGSFSEARRSWVISNGWEYQEFLLLYAIFSNR